MTTYPATPEIVSLFSSLGDLFVVRTEHELHFGGLNAFMSTYFELQQHLIGFGTAAGLPEADARRYVVSLLSMMADTSRITDPARFADLVSEHQTKGGLNERVRRALLDAGWFDAPGGALRGTTTMRYKQLG